MSQQQDQKLTPDKIGVIVAGFPNKHAIDVAKACRKRGYKVLKFGLCTDDKTSMDVPEIGQISLTNCCSQDVKSKLHAVVEEARKEGLFPIVADTSASEDSNLVMMYNELKVPFVLKTKGGASHERVVRETEQERQFALISEMMDKQMAALDSMWTDAAQRFPSLFRDYDFSLRASKPSMFPRQLLDSFSDLVNQPISESNVQRMDVEDAQKMGFQQGFASQEYSFKDGTGRSTFSFRRSLDDKSFADGMAEGIGFLAQRANQLGARPRVYTMLDVAQQGLLTW